jgi:predicted Zn-dependent protease
MSSSHAVEWIDLKEHRFCTDCASYARALARK